MKTAELHETFNILPFIFYELLQLNQFLCIRTIWNWHILPNHWKRFLFFATVYSRVIALSQVSLHIFRSIQCHSENIFDWFSFFCSCGRGVKQCVRKASKHVQLIRNSDRCIQLIPLLDAICCLPSKQSKGFSLK